MTALEDKENARNPGRVGTQRHSGVHGHSRYHCSETRGHHPTVSLSSSVRAQSANWAAVRETILARDKYRCTECGIPCSSAEADVHHLLPRSLGGSDEPSNLVTLCDGCHAAHHPKLAGRLARRMMERWAVRLALWLDRHRVISDASRNFGAALRLLGLDRFGRG